MPSVNLKDVAASGMVWNAFQKYTVLGVYFISSIILARLLTPHDYGCIGVLDIFIAVATIMIDGGFGSALLQKKNPTQEDYSTIFVDVGCFENEEVFNKALKELNKLMIVFS